MSTQNDFTPTGLKLMGSYENDRNSENRELYKAIIREVFGVQEVICGHHLVFVIEDKREDGFVYQVTEEVPAADTLIFDHGVMQKLFPHTWQECLMHLALTPTEERDVELAKLYHGREK